MKLKTLRIIVIFLLLTTLLGSIVFASDSGEVSSSPSDVIEDAPFYAPDLDMVRMLEAAQDIKAATATSYTIDDLYNLLYAALRGRSSSSPYSLVAMNSDIRTIHQDLSAFFSPSIGATPLRAIQEIHSILAGTATGLNPIANINEALILSAGNDTYSISELTGMIWSYVQDIASDTPSIHTVANNTSSIKSSVDDLININWKDIPYTYLGCSSEFPGGSYLSQSTNGNSFYFDFNITSSVQGPDIIRVLLPVRFYTTSYIDTDLITLRAFTYDSSTTILLVEPEYYLEIAPQGTYLYLINFNRYSGNFSFNLQSDKTLRYINSFGHTVAYLPFDNVYYQLIRTALNTQRNSDYLSDIANYIADPSKKAAQAESQELIDDTLDGFTGNGSAAAKVSDTSSMKNMSSTVRSGLSTGASASQATNMFNASSSFWQFFTQTCSNYVNYPYPAPVVEPTRGSGDEIIDFYSRNQSELRDLLGSDRSW